MFFILFESNIVVMWRWGNSLSFPSDFMKYDSKMDKKWNKTSENLFQICRNYNENSNLGIIEGNIFGKQQFDAMELKAKLFVIIEWHFTNDSEWQRFGVKWTRSVHIQKMEKVILHLLMKLLMLNPTIFENFIRSFSWTFGIWVEILSTFNVFIS